MSVRVSSHAPSSRGPLGVAVGALCAAVLLLAPTPACAVVVHTRGGQVLSYQPQRSTALLPLDAAFSNLDYNGGPVMPANTNYAVYWSPSGESAYGEHPGEYISGVNQYFMDLEANSGGHENVDSVAAQYNDSSGAHAAYDSHFGGALLDTQPYPASGCAAAEICLSDAQLRAELTRLVKANNLPVGLSTEYFLITPPAVESCFFDEGGFEQCSAGTPLVRFCAYHGNIATAGGQIIYSNDPYVTGNSRCDDGNHPTGKPSDGVLEGGLSHEHVESVTDPVPNTAWTDWLHNGGEIGDKCRTFEAASEFGEPLGKAANGAKFNQMINGHDYWYQQEWSNQSHECKQRMTLSGQAPTATFTSKAETGTSISFDASESTAPGKVHLYSWQFNDETGGTHSAPLETESATIEHKFPARGRYSVALTVYANDGTSSGTAQTVDAGDELPTAAFTVETPGPLEGSPVQFNAAASKDPDGEISSYEWSFGDGATAEGSSPAHIYAEAGFYEVRLTVADSSGARESVAHTILVAPLAPVAVTGGASVVGTDAATLGGTVDPRGSGVEDCHFDYGPTSAYGSSAPCFSLPVSGQGAVAVSAGISALSPGSTYSYRLVAGGPGGTSYGAEEQLATPASLTQPPIGPLLPVLGGAAPVPDAEIVGSAVTAVGGGVTVLRISCPATESVCTGTITLRVSAPASHGRHTTITLAAGGFTAAGGRVTSVRLRISGAALRLLTRSRTLRARATVTARDGAGAVHTANSRLTVRAPRAHR